MFGLFKKKIDNPKIKEFDEKIKKRWHLVNADLHYGDVRIYDLDEFINFAKRSNVGTVFKAVWSETTNYFYIADGKIIRTALKTKIPKKKKKEWKKKVR